MDGFIAVLATFFVFVYVVPTASLGETIRVDMFNFFFDPESLTVSVGDTVIWVNQVGTTHTTTSGVPCTPDGIWNSGNIGESDSFTYVFDFPGTYPYFCIPHCGSGMTGNIQVNMLGCIGGIVRDTAGVPLEGVLVEVLQSSIVMGVDTSDPAGLYEVIPLDPGIYDAVASKQGYLPDSVTDISVSQGCTPVNFELMPSPYGCGDCNGDGRTTIADATYLVAYIYRGGPGPVGQGDVNDDGRVTIADATYLVAFIYRGGSTPCESQ